MSRVLYACRGILVTVMPLVTLTGGLRKTVLSFDLLLGLAGPRLVDRALVHVELGAPRVGRVRDLHRPAHLVGRRAQDDAAPLRQGVLLRVLPVRHVDQHRRMELAVRVGHDDDAPEPGALVQLLAERDARHQVLPAQLAVGLDDARVVVRVPGVEDRRPALVVALGDEVALLHHEQRALRHRVAVQDPLRVLRVHHQDAFLALVRGRSRPRGSARSAGWPWCRPRTRPRRRPTPARRCTSPCRPTGPGAPPLPRCGWRYRRCGRSAA